MVIGEIMKTLYIVVPCFNEQEVLPETNNRLLIKIDELLTSKSISKQSRITYVDDGSNDKTWSLIESYHNKNKYVNGIKLSKNKGHQNALLAGLMETKDKADIVISMDADLQDDINAIDEFIVEYEKGNDIVYGVRKSRKEDSHFKRISAQLFYKFMLLMGVNIIYNHADYRLMSKRALDELENYTEVNLFIRGIVPLIGFKTSIVYYDRNKRFAGESKYPLAKMMSFAFEGITSFSVKPIKFILMISLLMFLTSICMIIYTFYRYFIGATINGWAFLNISVWFIAGVQTLLLGIVGEYVGKIYSETKKRPRYAIEEHLS